MTRSHYSIRSTGLVLDIQGLCLTVKIWCQTANLAWVIMSGADTAIIYRNLSKYLRTPYNKHTKKCPKSDWFSSIFKRKMVKIKFKLNVSLLLHAHFIHSDFGNVIYLCAHAIIWNSYVTCIVPSSRSTATFQHQLIQ